MLSKILSTVIIILIVLAAVIAVQPAEFHITRTATMAASPAAIFAQVNNLRKWEAWSPWAKLDPHAQTSYDGPRYGKGASMSWAGNSQVGEGKMTITESHPNEKILFRLDFVKPLTATNEAEFAFKPKNGQTEVSWSMSGHKGFLGKAMGL